MIRITSMAITVTCCLSTPVAGDDWEVVGRIIDNDRMPVAGADISPWWRANGSPRQADGTEYDLAKSKESSAFWGNIGQMEPWQPGARSDKDGVFQLNTHRKMHVLVMDQERKHGAVFRLTKKSHDGVEISLSPLTTVRARVEIKGSKAKPIWSHAYVHLEEDPEYPLASTRIVSCGSETQELEFRLPKGTYLLDVYAVSDKLADDIDLRVFPRPKIVIDDQGSIRDLGVLQLVPDEPDRSDLENESKEAGRWSDYTKHYGEPAPRWHAVDARRIKRDANIDDFRGRWLLLEFWGMTCAPCLSEHMPSLFEFYDKYANQRDKFEVVGVCIDFTGKLTTLGELDESLQPIVDKVWKGKRIPFPIVLDNTFKTWERYGIPGLGTSVLIDPAGNLVQGGTEELERVLMQAEASN